MSLLTKPYELHLTDREGDDYALTFIVRKEDFGHKRTVVEAHDEHGDLFNYIMFSESILDNTPASEGCFFVSTYRGQSEVVDGLILNGKVEVTGRVIDHEAEVRPDKEWLASLRFVDDNEMGPQRGKIIATVGSHAGRRYRSATTINGDFVWTIHERNPFYSRWSGDHGYVISAYSMTNKDIAFSTDRFPSIVEAWQQAERYGKALTEFFEQGERIAAKYNLSFFEDMFTNVAGNHWYLEG